jgi:hypothetical protein
MALHIKKRSTSVKGHMPKSIIDHSYESSFNIMVITHAEETDNCEAVRKYSASQSKHPETTETGNHASSK